MLRRRLLLALALAGCAMDLELPPAPVAESRPPAPTGVEPASAFAGERLLVRGTDLGTAATARVFVGDLPAMLAPDAAAGALALAMPDGLAAGRHAVRVVTAAGEGRIDSAVEFLGPGHPGGFALRADLDLRPRPSSAAAGEDVVFLVDLFHDQVIPVDLRTGNVRGAPAMTAPNPLLSFGNDQDRWVYALGGLDGRPRVQRLSWDEDGGRESCAEVSLDDVGTGTTSPPAVYNAHANAEGTLLAVPLGASEVLLVDTRTCPPEHRRVDLGMKVESVVVSGREVLVALEDRFARIREDGTVVVGDPPEELIDAIYFDGQMALDPGGRRAAYERLDGDVGFLVWDDAGSAPTIEQQTVFTYAAIHHLAFGRRVENEAATRLHVLHSQRVTTYDAGTGRLVGSAEVEDAETLAPGPTGEVLVTTAHGTTLLSEQGQVVRTSTLATRVPVYGIARAPGGRLYVASTYGGRTMTEEFDDVRLSLGPGVDVLDLDGVSSAGGGTVGWLGMRLYEYRPDLFAMAPIATSTHDILQATRSADGTHTAAVTREEALLRVETWGEEAWALPLPDAKKVTLLLVDDVLHVAIQTTEALRLERRHPTTLVLLAPAVALPVPGEFTWPVLRVPHWSRALDALVVPVSDLRRFGDGTEAFVAAHLLAVDRTGRVTRTAAPLPRALANPIVFSPDGRLFVSAEQRSRAGLDAARVEREGDTLVVRAQQHQDLPGIVGDAVFSPAGDRLFVTFPASGLVGLLQ